MLQILVKGCNELDNHSQPQQKAGHHRLASETQFDWRFCWQTDGGPTLNAGWKADKIATTNTE